MIEIEQFNAGNAAWRDNKWQEALDAYSGAASAAPEMALAHLGRARCLVKLEEWMQAREAFAQVIRLDPENYSAWLEAGHLCRQMGELNQAAGAYQRAIHAAPSRYEAYLGLARTLPLLGHAELGEEAFKDAIQHLTAATDQAERPLKLAELAQKMGQYRLEQGDVNGAVSALLRGIQFIGNAHNEALEEQRAELQIDLGEALWRTGDKERAAAALTGASISKSEATLTRLGALSFRLNLWQEALAVLERNVELHPESQQALWNLAHLLAECWQMEEAERILIQAETFGSLPEAASMRASMAGRRGDVDVALHLYRELASEPGAAKAASSAAMTSLYSDSLSAREVADLHRQLFAPLAEGARDKDSFKRAALEGRRLRLGIVSADFHYQHPVNIFMQPVLREFDRSRFEIFVYSTGVSHDDQTLLTKERVDHWIEATTLNDLQLSKRIDADQIDVLLDLAGHTGMHRMRLFAQRAAPVQVTYLGYPGSTGVPNMDWILGDQIVTPEADDDLCSEKVWRLPNQVFCYAPEEDYPFPHMPDDLAARPLTFASFNNVAKLTLRTLQLWAEVLASVPDSRLLLKSPSFGDASAVDAFGRRLGDLGVDLSRVEFRGPSGLPQMMAEYAEVDIALDPVPYNGGTTSHQALWMGVPILCQRGHHFVSRMGASIMAAAGLEDWVAQNDADYVRIAVEKASDRQALLELKRGLRSHLVARPGWDPVLQARAMEEALIGMAMA